MKHFTNGYENFIQTPKENAHWELVHILAAKPVAL
jgi:hypothetical protein